MKAILKGSLLSILAFVFLFPLLLTFSNSFMSSFEIASRYTSFFPAANHFGQTGIVHFADISFIPLWVTAEQCMKMLFGSPLVLGLFWNSVRLAVPILLGQLAVSAGAAYYFHVSRSRHKEKLFFVYIVVMLMPMQVSLVPNYIVAEFLGLQDSAWAIILPAVFHPFGAFLLRQFLVSLSPELLEAARLDGAGHRALFRHIILPLLRPAIAALAILTFIDSWNIVDQAVVFIRNGAGEPLSVYLSRFRAGGMDIAFAASCFYMLPAVLYPLCPTATGRCMQTHASGLWNGHKVLET